MTAPHSRDLPPSRLIVSEGSLPEVLADTRDPGESILRYVPGTDMPTWADGGTSGAVKVLDDVPTVEGAAIPHAWAGPPRFAQGGRINVNTGLTEIDQSLEFRLSGWAKADKPGARFYLEARDQNNATVTVQSGTLGAASGHLIANYEFPLEWTRFETVIKFRPGVTAIRTGIAFWNHPNGSERNATQMLADLRLVPIRPPASGQTASRPTDPRSGQMYFDTTIARPIWWDGSKWINASGGAV